MISASFSIPRPNAGLLFLLQNFHPHLHVPAADGYFYNDAAFMVCHPPKTGELEELFRYEVFKMLKAEGKITDVVTNNMLKIVPGCSRDSHVQNGPKMLYSH